MYTTRTPGGRPSQAHKQEIAEKEPLTLEEFALDWASKTPIHGQLPYPGTIRIDHETGEIVAQVPGLIARQDLAALEGPYNNYLNRFTAMKQRILTA